MRRLHHITRLDYSKTHAWWVRFQRGPSAERTTVSKMFSDGKWGGKNKALRAALSWRDAHEPLHPPLPHGNRGSGRKPQPAGYCSVIAYDRTQPRAGRRVSVTPVLLAKFKTKQGRFATLQLSVEKWGEATARRKIALWLREHRRKLKAKR